MGFSSSVSPLKGGVPNYSVLSPFSSIISLFNEYGFFNYYLYVDTSIYSQVFILHTLDYINEQNKVFCLVELTL